MIKSIQYFEERSISKFEKLENEFLKHPGDISSYVIGLTKELHEFGLQMIKESLELMNQMLRDSAIRKEKWVVESHDDKQLITSLGTVNYTKTLFTNKETNEMVYLLDKIMGLGKHERITADALEKLLNEAVQTSYRRGGEELSLEAEVSKQTVKNKLHTLKFPRNTEVLEKKKVVDYLYIDADEDHVALQFKEKKGDLVVNENGQKANCQIAKIVYVYEGIESEAPRSKRYKLVNPYYFCRVCEGKENAEFWDEIYEYIENHYDVGQIKKIYLNSDGGSWIMAGKRRMAGVSHVLDGFHLEKYMLKLTGHMLDSTEDARDEIYHAIKYQSKENFCGIVERLIDAAKTKATIERIQDSAKYILSNWSAAKIRLHNKKGIVGCSAEGHVSHVLSARMSSRPMGWSVLGIAQMVQLRAYYQNGGDMLELAKFQKEETPKAVGAEYDVLSMTQIRKAEKNRHGELGKYVESMTARINDSIKKKVYFNSNIWLL